MSGRWILTLLRPRRGRRFRPRPNRAFPGPLDVVSRQRRGAPRILALGIAGLSVIAALATVPALRDAPEEEPPREAYVGLASDGDAVPSPVPTAAVIASAASDTTIPPLALPILDIDGAGLTPHVAEAPSTNLIGGKGRRVPETRSLPAAR